MNSSDKAVLEEIVLKAETLPPGERENFIKTSCGADEALLCEVLRHLKHGSGPIDSSIDDEHGVTEEIPDLTGQSIGAYRVIRRLGGGGMGEVVLAERSDQQYEQRVAIKIVKPGVVSRQLQGRLKSERQILATLDHPNIAKLLDGGVTFSGAPYIVMEYIDGLPIDVYCDNHRLSIPDRLRLFQQVCGAVHAAHQRLIVHRDLKPSNILVTAAGVPKLLDFGIAKILDEPQAMHTIAVTHADYRVMTPDHASPEQILGLPVTTASDTYVLGVLLYELLTGQRPFTLNSTRFAELERIICEQQPPAPSAVVATTSEHYTPEQLETLAEQRSASLSKLRRQLRGELDNIVLMAMRKEPERRYSSVEQLSADVGRFLDNQPIIARQDSWSYRASKFVRRHAASVALTVALFAALAIFGATTWVQSNRIARERDYAAAQRERAEQQRARAEEVTTFLTDVFSVSDPSVAQGQTITARELLDRGAQKLEIELSHQPTTRAQLAETIGSVYMRLGLYAPAETLLLRSLAERQRLFGGEHADVASSLAAIGELRSEQAKYSEAEKLLQQALVIFDRSYGRDSSKASEVLHELGVVRLDAGRPSEAEAVLREALALSQKHAGPGNPKTTLIMNDLGLALHAAGQHAEASDLYTRVLDLTREHQGPNHPQIAYALHNRARAYQDAGDLTRSETEYREAIDVYLRVLGREHPDTIDAIGSFGALLQAKGDLAGAEQQFRLALDLDRKVRGPTHIYVGHDLSQLGALAIARSDPKLAEQYFRDALAIFETALGPANPYVATGKANLGRALVDQGRDREAAPLLEEAINAEITAFGPDSDQVAIARISLGRALTALRQYERAEEQFRLAYPVLLKSRGPDAPAVQAAERWITSFFETSSRDDGAAQFFAEFERPQER